MEELVYICKALGGGGGVGGWGGGGRGVEDGGREGGMSDDVTEIPSPTCTGSFYPSLLTLRLPLYPTISWVFPGMPLCFENSNSLKFFLIKKTFHESKKKIESITVYAPASEDMKHYWYNWSPLHSPPRPYSSLFSKVTATLNLDSYV